MISREQRTPFSEWWWTVDRWSLSAVLAIMAGLEAEEDQAAFWDGVRLWGPRLVEPMKKALELMQATDQADGNLPPVGDQDFPKHRP